MSLIDIVPINRSEFDESDHPLVLFSFEDSGFLDLGILGNSAAKDLLRQAREESFRSESGEFHAVSRTENGKKRRFILSGLGKKKGFTPDKLRRACGQLVRYATKRFSALAVAVPAPSAFAAGEGLLLGSYRFDEYRQAEKSSLAKVFFLSAPADRSRVAAALTLARHYAETATLVRTLVNRAPSDKTPQSLADLARSMAKGPVSTSVISRAQAADLGMGSFLGVARGSSVEPAFVHITYKPKGAKKRIALVGKGITFDSGGLSLKPPASMETMKCDMAGAATVLALMKALPDLKIKAEVHGICPITYNMPGPDALKPGDVVRAMNGKTIEVLNTDAEGRLVLADALVYAARLKPDAIIDLATLTGAVVTALGSQISAIMGNDRPLIARLARAAAAAEEHVSELPLFKEYRENIKSPIADIQNIGKKRGDAGSIIGGLFLEEFVDSIPWVHYDIAGTAWSESDGALCPRGGTGVMVRTLLHYLREL